MRAGGEHNYDVHHDPAPMPGPAANDPPKGGANVGTDVGAEKTDYPPGVHGCVADAMGRMHPIGEFGFRIRKSNLPRGFPPDEWGKLIAAAKKRIITEWANEQVLVATISPC